MTTNTTKPADSQVASIDTPEFRDLLAAVFSTFLKSDTTGLDAMAAFIDHINAKLAQANAAAEDFRHMAFLAANASRKAEARATALEAQLAAIQRGAANIKPWGRRVDESYSEAIDGNALSSFNACLAELYEFRALLQPQAQADTSGLPG